MRLPPVAMSHGQRRTTDVIRVTTLIVERRAVARLSEASVGYRTSPWSYLTSFSTREAGDYIAAIILIAGIVLVLPMVVLHSWGVRGPHLALLALLGAIPSVDAAIAFVNRAVTRGLGATILPGLALRDGVPSHLRTNDRGARTSDDPRIH